MSATGNSVVEFRAVGYRLPDVPPLLADFCLEVERGETMVLLGRSGSGKTTTLKLINRLLETTSGDVLVEGKSVREWDPVRLRRRIGYVIQEVGLMPHWAVEHNIGLVPRLEDWDPARTNARVRELMDMVGLDPALAERYPHELSGGQRQRVGVARALAADPPILLMDEPFGALDPITRADLQREFLALQRRLGKTIVFVTHDLHEALRLATRIALLEAGRLVGVYTPADFLRAKEPLAAAYAAAFLNDGPVNPGGGAP